MPPIAAEPTMATGPSEDMGNKAVTQKERASTLLCPLNPKHALTIQDPVSKLKPTDQSQPTAHFYKVVREYSHVLLIMTL